MNTLPTLYKKNHAGAVQQWSVIVKDNTFWTEEGHVNGAITSSKPTVCVGKNIGKANETTPEEQAYIEAKAKHQKKLDKGYTLDINMAGAGTVYFEPMLAKKFDEHKAKVKYPCLISRKIDGNRLIVRSDGMWTRNGKKFGSAPHIMEALAPVFDKHPDWVLDGEIYSTKVSFEKLNSLIKKKEPTASELAESRKYVQFWIFDGVIDDDQAIFMDRFNTIKSAVNSLVSTTNKEYFQFVENYSINSEEDIKNYHDKFVEEGYEGAMIRNPNMPYQNKRTDGLLKYKEFIDEEFDIVEVLEGQGNRSGMAGKLVIRLKDGSTNESGIRGGEDFYKELLRDRSKYIGKKATVRYQGITEYGKLRFPIAVNIDPIDR